MTSIIIKEIDGGVFGVWLRGKRYVFGLDTDGTGTNCFDAKMVSRVVAYIMQYEA